jgi:hypothetical protein
MKTFSAIATATPPEKPPNYKEDIIDWWPVIVPIILAAIAVGVFQHRITTLEDKWRTKEELDKEAKKEDKEIRKEDKEQIKELLENNNKILLANLTGEFGSVKQTINTLGRLLKSQEQTLNGQRERLLRVEKNVNDVLGIYGSRNRDKPP